MVISRVLTGRGADIIVIDDPLKPEEALSDAQRKAANEWYDHTLYSRLNDKRRGAIVIVMQRLHEDDLVGHVLAQEPWEIVRFPAIAEADEVHEVETILETRCFTRRRGEALHPDREPLDTLDRIRRTMGEYNFAGQYQQSPAPLGGGLVNFSVCTTWGVKDKELFLLAVFRQKLEYPALKRAVREQLGRFKATVVLIEDKASGTQLIQELIKEGCHAVTRYQPTTDKIMRLHAQTALIENGFVRIPEDAPWLAEYLHELTVFPKGKHDDQADSTAQFLDSYQKPGPNDGYFEWLRMEAEAIRNPENDRKRIRVLLKGPPYQQVQTFSNRRLEVSPDGMIELSAEDADPLIHFGWTKLAELPEYELPGYEDGYTEEQNEPPLPKRKYAIGSVESEARNRTNSRGPPGGEGTKGEDAISPRCGISGEQCVKVYLSILLGDNALIANTYSGIVLSILSSPRTETLLMIPQFFRLQARAEGSSLVSCWD